MEGLLGREDEQSTKQISDAATICDLKQTRLIEESAARMPKVDREDTERRIAFQDALLSVVNRMTPTQHQERPLAKNEKLHRIIKAMIKGVEPCAVRLSEAVSICLSETQTPLNARDFSKQVGHTQAKLVEVTGDADPALMTIMRMDAQKFRDRLIEKGSALAAVKRRIRTIKAGLILAGVGPDGLEGCENPFNKLGVAGLSQGSGRS